MAHRFGVAQTLRDTGSSLHTLRTSNKMSIHPEAVRKTGYVARASRPCNPPFDSLTGVHKVGSFSEAKAYFSTRVSSSSCRFPPQAGGTTHFFFRFPPLRGRTLLSSRFPPLTGGTLWRGELPPENAGEPIESEPEPCTPISLIPHLVRGAQGGIALSKGGRGDRRDTKATFVKHS